MLSGRSVADSSDDPVVVEALREIAQQRIELGDGAKPTQPLSSGWRTKGEVEAMPTW